MAETLEQLLAHLQARGQPGKLVVWAHNSHVGDARATEMGEAGQLTLGQLARERHGGAVRLVGFTTYDGTVIAASNWDEPGELRNVRPALAGSYEELFHHVGTDRFILSTEPANQAHGILVQPRLERAIGVIYRPETERQSHYFRAQLADQFDVIIHCDGTRAVEPLETTAVWDDQEPAETFPSGV